MKTINALMATLPQLGKVQWLGIRPARRAAMSVVSAIEVDPEEGIAGDRYQSRGGVRQVTMLQAEHLPALASILGRDAIDPELLRRNILVSGINLLALKNRHVRIGGAVLMVTGQCHPCSRMEAVLGPGGYNALRGHGGMTAQVRIGGTIALGDEVAMCAPIGAC